MIADYAADPTLYPRCMALIDECFPGIEAIAADGKVHHAHWDHDSTPFIMTENNEIIGHVGVFPFEIVLNGKAYQAGALHGVCIKKTLRRRGFFKQLMIEALAYIHDKYDFGFLFTDQPFLYEQFGFKVINERDAVLEKIEKSHHQPVLGALRKLDLNLPQDLALMQEKVKSRRAISPRFGIINETTVFTLNVLQNKIFYAQEADLLIVYEILKDCLILKEVVSGSPFSVEKVCHLIPESFSRVICQFSLDAALESFTTIKAIPECALMVTSGCEIGPQPFRYPEMYRC